MRLLALVLVPLVAAAAAYAHRSAGLRNGWLLGAAASHLVLVGSLWARPERPVFGDWLALDALGIVVLTVVTVLFAVVAVYAIGYQRTENPRGGRALVSCLLAFLASTSLVTLSHHLALLWVGMEATTLAMAPLPSIVGVWTLPGQGCKREDGALTIKPLALEGEDVSCKFRTVKRTGNRVEWNGVCDGAEGSSRQKVIAIEVNGKLTLSYHPGGNVIENLERCPR